MGLHSAETRHGIWQTQSVVVKDTNGRVCETPEATHIQWRGYFTKVVNINCSPFHSEIISFIRQQHVLNGSAAPLMPMNSAVLLSRLHGGSTKLLKNTVKSHLIYARVRLV